MKNKYVPVAVLFCTVASLLAQTDQAPLTDRERAMLARIEQLEKRLAALEAKQAASAADAPAPPTSAVSAGASDSPSFASGATLNLYFDGYYSYNFNRPVGRANLLRANDTLSNNFTLNQAALILERAPDVAAGRRFGARLDLMFGQNTETLQGSPANEPRPQVYRNLFQAYGTYVFPIGRGLTVDLGKFASALGFENNYAYDEINYSRSFYFNFLPFYHMGFRTTYNVNDKLAVQYWLVNGANQTEDFNGFKSNAFLFTIKPAKTVSWNVNYYVGREGRSDGRTHIFDTYASWSPANWTLAGEFDDVVSRSRENGQPSRVIGGAAYLQYRFTPKFSLSGRFEYLKDNGGLFGGVSQALKEHTLTATYQPADGVQLRMEYRRDFSNHPFFLAEQAGILEKEQNTATLGMIWWFGGKRESW